MNYMQSKQNNRGIPDTNTTSAALQDANAIYREHESAGSIPRMGKHEEELSARQCLERDVWGDDIGIQRV